MYMCVKYAEHLLRVGVPTLFWKLLCTIRCTSKVQYTQQLTLGALHIANRQHSKHANTTDGRAVGGDIHSSVYTLLGCFCWECRNSSRAVAVTVSRHICLRYANHGNQNCKPERLTLVPTRCSSMKTRPTTHIAHSQTTQTHILCLKAWLKFTSRNKHMWTENRRE